MAYPHCEERTQEGGGYLDERRPKDTGRHALRVFMAQMVVQ